MLTGENLGFSTTRSIEIGRGFEHVFCCCEIIQHHTVSLKEVNYLFPLYLYPDTSKENLFSDREFSEERKPNLNPKVVEALKATYRQEPTPEEIFHYIYAIFYAGIYREKYAELLKIDFPRVPFTADFKLFQALVALGKQLVDLHLLSPSPWNRELTLDEIRTYCLVVTAIQQTIALQEEIDALYPEVEERIVEMRQDE